MLATKNISCRLETAKIDKKQRHFYGGKENVYLKSLFLLPLSYVAKGNRIDREEVRAQLQKFQHAKVDRPAVLPYVTRFAASAISKQKEETEGGGRGKKEIRVTFSFCAETKASFPL